MYDLNNPLHVALLYQQGQLSDTSSTPSNQSNLIRNPIRNDIGKEQTNVPLRQELESHVNEDEEVFHVYGDKNPHIYKKVTKPNEDTLTDTLNLRYLSPYYPPPPSSFGNMFRYLMYKIPLGGTKRKRKRARRTKHRK